MYLVLVWLLSIAGQFFFVYLPARISAVRQVEYLQECQFLHTVLLEGNPMDRLEAYRARVIFRLQGLMVLDRNKVKERWTAHRTERDTDGALWHQTPQ